MIVLRKFVYCLSLTKSTADSTVDLFRLFQCLDSTVVKYAADTMRG